MRDLFGDQIFSKRLMVMIVTLEDQLEILLCFFAHLTEPLH